MRCQCAGPYAQGVLRICVFPQVKVALYAKRLHFTSVALSCGTTASTEYTQVNPLKKIPALVVTHTDSAQVRSSVYHTVSLNYAHALLAGCT